MYPVVVCCEELLSFILLLLLLLLLLLCSSSSSSGSSSSVYVCGTVVSVCVCVDVYISGCLYTAQLHVGAGTHEGPKSTSGILPQ